jgi:glycyl-tRNA synthetase beta chain
MSLPPLLFELGADEPASDGHHVHHGETAPLLLELGTEELPAKGLRALAETLAARFAAALAAAGIQHGPIAHYATPRRLALRVTAVHLLQPERELLRRGPALTAAFDDEGRPTRAAQGFAASCGVAVEALGVERSERGSWLCHRTREPGVRTVDLLPGLLERLLDELPLERRMRWGEGPAAFLRPVHWVVLLLEEEVVHARLLGCATGRVTQGHRVHGPGPIELAHVNEYPGRLAAEGHVLADFAERRARILEQVSEVALRAGAVAAIGEDLLEEVTGLVEWPVALLGRFDPAFLALPPEVLVATLRDHQKVFHCVDPAGQMLPCFVAVANLASTDPAAVRRGNERVVRPRLADAAFFWAQDAATPLADRLPSLAGIVFQQGLGSLHDKTLRVARLATTIAPLLGAPAEAAERAARLSRCDLVTGLVGEFPELQGTLGRHLALASGEPAAVADAIGEFYLPRQAGDRLPVSPAGQAIALADRLDTLVGCFAIGAIPSGDRDPFALRRSALGAMRILLEAAVALDLESLLGEAARGIGSEAARAAVPEVFDFCFERLRGLYPEEHFPVECFDAVLCRRPTRPLDFDARLRALAAFRTHPAAPSLAAAHKRITHLLRKVEEPLPPLEEAGAFEEPVELALAAAVAAAGDDTGALIEAGRYDEALSRLAGLREPVDAFFEGVMVLAEDPAVRARRLALLGALEGLFLCIADLSRLPGTAG